MIRRTTAAICFVFILLTAHSLTAQNTALQTPIAERDIPPNLTIHVVQRGENLYRIALLYSMTYTELAEINGISNTDSLLVGQRLLVPASPPAEVDQTHIVQPGETLSRIAGLYGADMATLMRLNDIANPNTIYAGQLLDIPTNTATAAGDTATAASVTPEPAITPANQPESTPELVIFELPTEASPATPTATPTNTPAPTQVAAANTASQNVTVHVVRRGETLYSIAQGYALTVQDIASANGLNDVTRIYAGQRLIVPTSSTGEPTESAVELPEPLTSITLRPLIFTEGETGGIRIQIDSPAQTIQIKGSFISQELHFYELETGLYGAMVGIPIFTEADVYPLQLTITSGVGVTEYAFNVRVAEGAYFTQNLTIGGDLATLLDPNVEQYEWTLLEGTTSRQTPQRTYNGPLSLPAAAAMNGPFGSRRSYNGGPVDRYHNGADFASPIGAPIFAAAGGTVVLSDRLNIRGNHIIIDHGWGLYTTYSHLTDRFVSPGDTVRTGDTIGSAGSSGRITGPHLHWEVWVHGVPVNPMQWVRESFP